MSNAQLTTDVKARRHVLIVTGQHFADAPRKVDLHFMAHSLLSRGDRVDFLVWRLSPISRLLKDGRYAFARTHRLNQWEGLSEGLRQFIWFQLFHPMNLKFSWLNRLADPLFSRVGAFCPKRSATRCLPIPISWWKVVLRRCLPRCFASMRRRPGSPTMPRTGFRPLACRLLYTGRLPRPSGFTIACMCWRRRCGRISRRCAAALPATWH